VLKLSYCKSHHDLRAAYKCNAIARVKFNHSEEFSNYAHVSVPNKVRSIDSYNNLNVKVPAPASNISSKQNIFRRSCTVKESYAAVGCPVLQHLYQNRPERREGGPGRLQSR